MYFRLEYSIEVVRIHFWCYCYDYKSCFYYDPEFESELKEFKGEIYDDIRDYDDFPKHVEIIFKSGSLNLQYDNECFYCFHDIEVCTYKYSIEEYEEFLKSYGLSISSKFLEIKSRCHSDSHENKDKQF